MKVGDRVRIVNDLAKDYTPYKIVGEVATIVENTGKSSYRLKEFGTNSPMYQYLIDTGQSEASFNIYKVRPVNRNPLKEFFFMFDVDLGPVERILRIL